MSDPDLNCDPTKGDSAQDRRRVSEKPASPTDSASTVLTYEVEREEGGWASKMTERSAQMLIEKVGDGEPKEDFCAALDSCCNRFYPDIHDDQRPWVEHSKADDSEEWIRERATEKWALDWYWRTLIMDLRSLVGQADGNSDEIFIRLSQVRQWLMLATYKEIEDETELLRPPMFGRSGRLIGRDQYWLYLSHAGEIGNEWRKIKESSSLSNPYLMGRHTVEYKVNAADIRQINDDKLAVSIDGSLHLHPHLEASDVMPNEKHAPHDLLKIPTFRNRTKPSSAGNDAEEETEESGDVKEQPLLMASDEVCRVTEVLSGVWNDPTHTSVHINAPPGSGKEVLTQTLFWFKQHPGKLAISAWIPDATEVNRRMLFGSESSEGLVNKSLEGCLVLDEIDKVDEKTRASLLRLMENGEYVGSDGGVTDIPSQKRPLFVLLSSKPLDDVVKMEPRDLWTRVELTIQMSHPLDVVDERERRRVWREYFHMFWISHLEDFVEEKLLQKNLPSSHPVSKYTKEVLKLLCSGRLCYRTAEIFAEQASRRRRDMSVRDIRTVAKRCVFNTVRIFLYVPRSVWSKDYETYRDAIEGSLVGGGQFEEEFDHVLKTIVERSLEGRAAYVGG